MNKKTENLMMNKLKSFSPGIVVIKNNQNNRFFIEMDEDIPRFIDKTLFILKSNSYIIKELQNIYNEFGEESIMFDVMENIDIKKFNGSYEEIKNELNNLLKKKKAEYIEKYLKEGYDIYNRSSIKLSEEDKKRLKEHRLDVEIVSENQFISDVEDCTVDEIKKGYKTLETGYKCLCCNQFYESGEIVKIENRFFNAQKAMEKHIEFEHGSIANYLLDLDKKDIGVSDVQKNILLDMFNKLSNNDIGEKEHITQSTVRNHKFKLKEKLKQAKLFVALMEHIEEIENNKNLFLDGLNSKEDDRDIIKKFISDGKLIRFPKNNSDWDGLLCFIAKTMGKNKEYTEKEINKLLINYNEDYVTLRRYLIEFGYLDRDKSGKKYWAK